MQEQITVRMTEQALFDFMLYHTYSQLSGFLTNILGIAVGFTGIFMKVFGQASVMQMCMYLLASVVFIAYNPVLLLLRARKYIRVGSEYKEPVKYSFSDAGINILGNESKSLGWEQIEKVVATPKTIGLYYGKNEAIIVPKEQFGDKFLSIMKIVTAFVKRQKITIN